MVSSRALLRVSSIILFLTVTGSGFAQTSHANSRFVYVDMGGDAGSGSGSGAGPNHGQGQGYLGILFHDVNDNEIGPMHLKDGHGAEIVMVDHDGPAGKAGLREHDVVLSANGVTVDGEEQLRKMLHDLSPGRTISFVVCRNGVEQTINAVMANREEVERQAWQKHAVIPAPARTVPDDAFVAPAQEPAPSSKGGFGHSFMSGHLLPLAPPYTGATVDSMGSQLADYFGVPEGKGLLVHDVEPNSPAATAGLHAGDVVTRINGNVVATEKDWTRSLHDSKGRSMSLTVVRDRKEQTLTMVPDSKRRSSVERPIPPQDSSRAVMMLR